MLSLNAKAYSQTIARIYDAAYEGGAWSDALTSLAGLFGSGAAWFFDVDPRENWIRRSTRVGVDTLLLQEYDAYYVNVCPRLSHYIANPMRRVYYDHLHTSERGMERSEYYAWLSRFQMRHYFAMRVSPDTARPILLTFHRNRTRGHVTPGDLKLAELIIPHIERAVFIANDVQSAALRMSAFEQITNNASLGIVVVDPSLKVLRVTPTGEKVLAAGNGLSVRQGYLTAENSRDNDALRTSVAAAARAQAEVASVWSTSITIGRASGSRPYRIVVAPLWSEKLTHTSEHPAISVHILESARPLFDVQSIAGRLGLTKAEAEIARALASGETIPEYAKRVSRSVHTVRWHLKGAMAKTGTARQVELVRLVLTLAPEN